MSQADRDALVLSCDRLCRKLAIEAGRTIPGADGDDLYGDAVLYCVEASRKFEPGGSAKFSTFCTDYIRKKLLGQAAAQRENAVPARIEKWNLVPDREAGDDTEEEGGDGPDADARELLAKLTEPARTAVRLVVFDGIIPERVAVQLGLPVKDLKLMLRNAGKELVKEKHKLDLPGLFDELFPNEEEAD